jgi:hypothetical protein
LSTLSPTSPAAPAPGRTFPAPSGSSVLDPGSVALVFWPAEEDRRQELADAGHGRLLLLPADAPPPSGGDPLEDWIREPFDPADLDARVLTLLGRMRRAERVGRRPSVDPDGLLRSGPLRVALSSTQAALVRVLVDHLGEVVGLDRLRQASVEAGAAGTPQATARTLHRCRARLVRAELDLHVLRARGAMVCLAPDAARRASR